MGYFEALEIVDKSMCASEIKELLRDIILAIDESDHIKKVSNLKVGDFVRYIGPNNPDSPPYGLAGKIVDKERTGLYDWSVEFPEHTEGHSCDGCITKGHGYWCNSSDLKKIKD